MSSAKCLIEMAISQICRTVWFKLARVLGWPRAEDLADSTTRRIVIFHYGEEVPSDPHYRPHRYGRFAAMATAMGRDITRVSPSMSHLRRVVRPVGSSFSDEGKHEVVRTVRYRGSRSPRRALFLLTFTVQCMRRARLLDCHDVALVGYPPFLLVTAIRLANRRLPIVVDIRDIWFQDADTGASVLTRALASVSRWELRAASAVVCLSDGVDAWTKRSDCHVIPIGVPEFPSASSSTDNLRCVFVGMLEDNFLLTSLVEVWPTDADATLDIFGVGSKADSLVELTKDRENVVFHGSIEADRVPSVLAEFDIGVTPTREGFGTVISNKVCEYLACGLYVVHSLEPGPAKFLSDNCFGEAFDPTSARSVADMLAHVELRKSAIRDGVSYRRDKSVRILGAESMSKSLLAVLDQVSQAIAVAH